MLLVYHVFETSKAYTCKYVIHVAWLHGHQNNRLSRIDFSNWSAGIRVLDLSGNLLDSIHGIAKLPDLERLNVAKNRLKRLSIITGMELRKCNNLRSLDLSENQISSISLSSDFEECKVEDFFAFACPSIRILITQVNPLSLDIPSILSAKLPHLVFLNDRRVGHNAADPMDWNVLCSAPCWTYLWLIFVSWKERLIITGWCSVCRSYCREELSQPNGVLWKTILWS
jgi:hypothetical protein